MRGSSLMRHVLLAGLLLAGSLCFGPPDAEAITRNGSAAATQCFGGSSCATNIAIAGSNPFLAVCVAWYHYLSTPSISTATYNGLPLTLWGAASNPSCGDQCKVALYYLANPATGGSQAASISFGAGITGAVVGAALFNDVDPATPIGTASTATGNSAAPAVTVASASSEVVMDCLGALAAGGVPTVVGQTLNWSLFDGGGFIHGASGYQTGSPVTAMSWGLSATQQWAMVAGPIKPVSGGGGSPPPPPGGSQILITWQDNSDNEQFFHLVRRTDQSYPNWVDVATQIPANTTSYIDDIGTQSGPCYMIEATNQGGTSGFTPESCLTGPTPPPPPSPPPPGAGGRGGLTFDFEEDLL